MDRRAGGAGASARPFSDDDEEQKLGWSSTVDGETLLDAVSESFPSQGKTGAEIIINFIGGLDIMRPGHVHDSQRRTSVEQVVLPSNE